jgi:hypothetical protein
LDLLLFPFIYLFLLFRNEEIKRKKSLLLNSIRKQF